MPSSVIVPSVLLHVNWQFSFEVTKKSGYVQYMNTYIYMCMYVYLTVYMYISYLFMYISVLVDKYYKLFKNNKITSVLPFWDLFSIVSCNAWEHTVLTCKGLVHEFINFKLHDEILIITEYKNWNMKTFTLLCMSLWYSTKR